MLKFLGYLWGPIPWMIEAAAVLSGTLCHFEDLSVIVVLPGGEGGGRVLGGVPGREHRRGPQAKAGDPGSGPPRRRLAHDRRPGARPG